jgi:ketosteroid isomerase-like protein
MPPGLKCKIKSIMHDFVGAMAKGDVEKGVSLCAEDVVWSLPEGTFKGREGVKHYLTWLAQSTADRTVTDSGIGIMVQGNKAVYEHSWKGTMKGMKWEGQYICVYEFSDEKIQNIRTVYDRLSIAKQAAKGWLARTIVNSIAKRWPKGSQ